MKIKKILMILSIFFIFVLSSSTVIHADTGPKPSTTVKIVGIEGQYVAAFAAKEATGPNFDYKMWQDGETPFLDYNPIMEYSDTDGYKWITKYKVLSGDKEINFTYYRPESFKIIIYQNDKLYKVTDVIDTFSFNNTFKIDFSSNDIKITKNFSSLLNQEVGPVILRFVLTLVVEIGLLFAMMLYTKRNLTIALITNIVTQILLNVILNIAIYYHGWQSALMLLFVCEFFIFVAETTVYALFMKDKKTWKIIVYGVLANALTFALSFLL